MHSSSLLLASRSSLLLQQLRQSLAGERRKRHRVACEPSPSPLPRRNTSSSSSEATVSLQERTFSGLVRFEKAVEADMVAGATVTNGVLTPLCPDRTLDEVLSLPQVQIKDRNRTMSKIRKMVNDGVDKLLVISDFDHTLSRAYDEKGKTCWTTHAVFDNETLVMDQELVKKLKVLRAHYHPIEFDNGMTMEEKIPHMENWWRESHQHIVDTHVDRATIENFVRGSYIRLRDDAPVLLRRLEEMGVPLILFSAGIGDVITIFLKQQLAHSPSNIHFISNVMTFDSNDRLQGFSDPLIHTFNKNGSVIGEQLRADSRFAHDVDTRSNVILMGDSMGDVSMAMGVENHRAEDTLKIGFLNKRPELLPHYLNVYDIVLVDDQSVAVPNALLEAIFTRAAI